MQYAAHRVFLFLLNQFINRVSPRGVGKLRRLLARSGSQRQQLRNANDSDGAGRSFCDRPRASLGWEQQATRRKSAVHQGVERVRNSLFHRVKNVSFSHTPAVTPKLIGAAEATSRCSSRIYNGGW